MQMAFKSIFRFVLIAAAPVTGALLCGCASDESRLQMISLDHQHNFTQDFSEAYASKTDVGDMDIVLAQDAPPTGDTDDLHKGIAPSAGTLPRQLVHIRVFWTALNSKADHPASTNASIHWFVYGDRTPQAQDPAHPASTSVENVLEYTGSGLVMIEQSGDSATIEIRNSWLKATARSGSMADPIGPSNMTGIIHAQLDPQRVQSILAQLRGTGAPLANADATQPQHLTVTPAGTP